MNIKKITKEATIDKVLSNEIRKLDKVLSKKVLKKIVTTSKDDWKNYYKNLNLSINSVVHDIAKKNIHCNVKGIL